MRCKFCEALEADPNLTYTVNLYGEIDASTNETATKVNYTAQSIPLARCHLCRSKHRLSRFTQNFAVIWLASFVVILILTVLKLLTGLIAGLLLGSTLMMFLMSLALSSAYLKGIYSIAKAKKTFPEITNLLDAGYKIGRVSRIEEQLKKEEGN